MQLASAALVDKPEHRAAIQKQFFAKAEPEAAAAVKAMNSGVAGAGKLDVQGMQNQLTFAKEVGTNFGKEFDARASENDCGPTVSSNAPAEIERGQYGLSRSA